MHISSLILIITLAILAILAPNKQADYHEFTLKNGLRIVAIPNHKIPAVTHMIWYRVGAADELVGKSGFAHLFEHLMFKATKNLKNGEFSKIVARHGGNDNAFTSQDFTAYFQTIAKEHLPKMMEMEAERMKNLTLSKEIVQKERDIVLEERSMRVDNKPASILAEKVRKELYQNHPYAIPVIGWRDEIAKLSVDDVAKFYKTYYNPNNATVIISGDVDIATLKPMAEKYYGHLENSNKIQNRDFIKIIPNTPKNNQIEHIDPRVKNPKWSKTFTAPSANSGKTQYADALNILATILGGQTGRIHNELVLKQKLAASTQIYFDDIKIGPSSFSFNVSPSKNITFKQVAQAIEIEIQKILNGKISQEEITHAKNTLTADYIYTKDGISPMAFIYGHVLASGLDINYIQDWYKNIHKVSKNDIISAAKAIFISDSYVIGILKEK